MLEDHLTQMGASMPVNIKRLVDFITKLWKDGFSGRTTITWCNGCVRRLENAEEIKFK